MKFLENNTIELVAYFLSNTVIGYLGLSVGMKKGDDMKDFHFRGWRHKNHVDPEAIISQERAHQEGAAPPPPGYLMDTSVIIDGRIVDLVATGIIEREIIVPQFVLAELQAIADSSDPTRRSRGKRGLDILQKLQRGEEVTITISNKDPREQKAVDAKLVVLAKELGTKILTNDSNLNKVAELQGVGVLNINQLASALKPDTPARRDTRDKYPEGG